MIATCPPRTSRIRTCTVSLIAVGAAVTMATVGAATASTQAAEQPTPACGVAAATPFDAEANMAARHAQISPDACSHPAWDAEMNMAARHAQLDPAWWARLA
jgi:hypothetical protein